MKLDLSFSQNSQKVDTSFNENKSALSSNFGELTVLHDGQNGATFTPNVSEDGMLSWTNDRELPNPEPVNIKGKDGKDGIDGKDGKNGVDGKNGIDGKDGYTPIKGEDYFTAEEVQEIAEQAAELVDIPEGGVTSWNDLTDKPFYDDILPPIIWSGNFEDYELTALGYKISERGLTKDELIGATQRFYNADLTEERSGVIGPDALFDFSQNNPDLPPDTLLTVANASFFISVAADITLQGVTASKGFYVSSERFISLTFPQTIKTLDEKYLPDSVVLENELEGKGYQTEEQVTALINEAISNLPRYNGEVEEI